MTLASTTCVKITRHPSVPVGSPSSFLFSVFISMTDAVWSLRLQLRICDARFFINISFPFPTRHKLDGTLKAVSCGGLSQSLGSVRRLSPDFCNVCHSQADKLTAFIVKQKHRKATKYEQALIRHVFLKPLADSTLLPSSATQLEVLSVQRVLVERDLRCVLWLAQH